MTENMADTILETRNLDFFYDEKQALFKVNFAIERGTVTGIMGPSGCGKSTLLKTFNRMYEPGSGRMKPSGGTEPMCRAEGEVLFNGRNVLDRGVDPILLRHQIGMIFQRPNAFPMSIYDNVAFGPRKWFKPSKADLNNIVEESLQRAGLWDEVKDDLRSGVRSAGLSGGQEQRLVIARTIAVNPSIILMDEPCSALDPISTAKIEDLIDELKGACTIVIVTHNLAQAARVSDFTAYMHMGELVEFGETEQIFKLPRDPRTSAFIEGRCG